MNTFFLFYVTDFKFRRQIDKIEANCISSATIIQFFNAAVTLNFELVPWNIMLENIITDTQDKANPGTSSQSFRTWQNF